jgi:hypothetical protein
LARKVVRSIVVLGLEQLAVFQNVLLQLFLKRCIFEFTIWFQFEHYFDAYSILKMCFATWLALRISKILYGDTYAINFCLARWTFAMLDLLSKKQASPYALGCEGFELPLT